MVRKILNKLKSLSVEGAFYSMIVSFITVGTIQNTYHDDITYWLLWIMIGLLVIGTGIWFSKIRK